MSSLIIWLIFTWQWVKTTEQRDTEAQAQIALIQLAPRVQYFAALGPDSLSPIIQTE
jgi:hypothetical protein